MRTVATGKSSKLLATLRTRWKQLSVATWIAAVFYTQFIVDPQNAERTRISENALMPTIAEEVFSNEAEVARFLSKFKEKSVREVVKEELVAGGLHVYKHLFHSDLALLNVSTESVVGVLRAHRAASVEAIVVGCSLDDSQAVAMLLAYATFARQEEYWARDVNFLFLDGFAAADAWFAAYSGDRREAKSPLPTHSGPPTAAIFIKSTRRDTVNILFNGVNGQLVNLDMVNSIVRLASSQRLRVPVAFAGVDYDDRELWWMPLKNVETQAFVAAQGLHSVASRYGHQSLTLELPSASRREWRSSIRLLEGTIRIVNNLAERLHQSYFLYILVPHGHFLSIAYFMPLLGLLLAPLLLAAFAHWNTLESVKANFSYFFPHVFFLLLFFASSVYLAGAKALPNGTFLFLSGLLLVPWTVFLSPPSEEEQETQRLFVYLEMALIGGGIGLLNFGLSLYFAVPVVLLVFFYIPTSPSKTVSFLRVILLPLTHPFSLYLLYLLSVNHLPFNTSLFLRVPRLLRALAREQLLLGSHLFFFVFLSVFVWNSLLRFLRRGSTVDAAFKQKAD